MSKQDATFNTLIWVVDSPYSRATKWLLSQQQVPHHDHLISWQELTTDSLLVSNNPKRQVPTLLLDDHAHTDSLLIALPLLGAQWCKTADAKLFRLGDSDLEAAIIFLFRANLLEDKFGADPRSELMRDSGRETYRNSVDILLDAILLHDRKPEVNFGLIMAFSTLLACRMLCRDDTMLDYRRSELIELSSWINLDGHYSAMQDVAASRTDAELPFAIV